MKDSIINMGVIGLGGISNHYIPTCQKDRVSLAAIWDIDKLWLGFQRIAVENCPHWVRYPEILFIMLNIRHKILLNI